MKIEKYKKYKLQRKKRFKKIMIGTSITLLIAAGVFIPTISAMNQLENGYDNEINQDKTYEDEDLTIFDKPDFFANSKSYYEYPDNAELNSVIDEIKDINYQTNNEYFDYYNIYEVPQREILELRADTDVIFDENIGENTYDWYVGGKVNSEKLYNKILSNTKNKGIDVNQNVEEIIKSFCNNLQSCIDLIKSKKADYYFDAALKNIDELSISGFDDDIYMGFYDYSTNLLQSDYNYTKEQNIFDYNIIHETMHVLSNKTLSGGNYYANGFNIEDMSTSESPLFLDFITERIVDEYACELCPNKIVEYDMEKYYIDSVCNSTGINYGYVQNSYLDSDLNQIIDAFEPEFRDFNWVYATLDGLDLACGYGYIPDGCDANKFKTDVCFNSKVNLLKNGYVRIIKDMVNNKITYDKAKSEILKLKQKILVDKYYSNNVENEQIELNNCIERLDNIFYRLQYSKSK